MEDIFHTDMRTALLAQDKKSQELRTDSDNKSRFSHQAVEDVFRHQGRDEKREALNKLVDIANDAPESSLTFSIYDALNKYYAEHFKSNDKADPFVAYHMFSILNPEPFVTNGGASITNGHLGDCTNFNFILDIRRKKIKGLPHKQ